MVFVRDSDAPVYGPWWAHAWRAVVCPLSVLGGACAAVAGVRGLVVRGGSRGHGGKSAIRKVLEGVVGAGWGSALWVDSVVLQVMVWHVPLSPGRSCLAVRSSVGSELGVNCLSRPLTQ